MVCFEGGIVCVPKLSLEGVATCFRPSIRCDGEHDCADGQDEKDCSRPFETGGALALLVIGCILVVIAIPVIYIVVKKKRGEKICPSAITKRWKNFRGHSDRNDENHNDTARLENSRNTTSPAGANNDGFTQASFDAPPQYSSLQGNGYGQQPTTAGRFQKHLDSDQRSPSIREWQTNRLNGHSPDHKRDKDAPKAKKDLFSAKPNGSSNQYSAQYRANGQSGNVHLQPNTQTPNYGYQPRQAHSKDMTSSPYNGGTPQHGGAPFTITQNTGLPQSTGRPSWERPGQQKEPSTGYPSQQNYGQPAPDGGVSPGQLRSALQYAGPRQPYAHAGGYSPGQSSYTAADTSTDTVV